MSWLAAILSLFLISLWLRIYIPASSSIANKTWGEINFFSPRLGDLINASHRASGIHKVIYDRLNLSNPPTYERSLGLTFTLMTFVIVVSILLIRKSKLISKGDQGLSWSLLFLSILPMLIIVQDEFGRSAWYPFWKIIPGIESLRAPFRVAILSSWILLGLMFYLLRHAKSITVVAISLVVMFDSSRPVPFDWQRNDLFGPNAAVFFETLQSNSCDTFYARPDQVGDNTIFQIESQIISTFSSIPTINGYSGNFAKGWKTGLDPASDEQILDWLRINNAKEQMRVCVLNQTGNLINTINYSEK